jgi:hypothetical protein
MDLVGVKKRLKDYEQMLEYYTSMRTNNKMKDFEAEFKEWWEVVDEYFTKELEKNLVDHRANEFRVEITDCSKRDRCLEGYEIFSFHFLSFYKDFVDEIQSIEGVMLKG